MKIKNIVKNNYKYWLFLIAIGIIGGIFTGFYILEITDPAILEEALRQVGGEAVYVLISTVQVISYALIFGILGKAIAEKLGLWRELRFDGRSVTVAALSGLGVGAAMMALEFLWFVNLSEVIKESYNTKPTLINLLASLTYGGVIEELMIRLFLMSLIAIAVWKIFFRREDTAPAKAIVIANIVAAILFSAAHLPATAMSVGITPVILIRCFTLNGAAGLVFGRLYHTRGIQYAMIAHAFAHVAMKLIWLLAL